MFLNGLGRFLLKIMEENLMNYWRAREFREN